MTGGISSATQQILSKTDPFDIRVYGENYGLDYPDASGRSLVIQNMQFKAAAAPSVPVQKDQSSYPAMYARNAIIFGGNGDGIKFYYYNVQNESGSGSSTAILSGAQLAFSEKETFAMHFPLVGASYTEASPKTETVYDSTDNSPNDIVNLDEFYVQLTGLRAGTRYDFKIRVRNDLSATYSSWSSAINYTAGAVVQEGTYYTWLPPDSGGSGVTGGFSASWFDMNNWTGVSGHTKISSPADAANLTGAQIIYVNKSGTAAAHKKLH